MAGARLSLQAVRCTSPTISLMVVKQRPHWGIFPHALNTLATLAAPFSTLWRTDLQLIALQTQTYMTTPFETQPPIFPAWPHRYCNSLSSVKSFIPIRYKGRPGYARPAQLGIVPAA